MRRVSSFDTALELSRLQHKIIYHCADKTATQICVGRGGVGVRMPDFQSRYPGFESSCCHFEALAIFSLHVASVHSAV